VGVLDDSGDGEGRSVGLGLEQPLEDNLVELGVRSSSEEAVKLGGLVGCGCEEEGGGVGEGRGGLGAAYEKEPEGEAKEGNWGGNERGVR
jgi:hypothetical protein